MPYKLITNLRAFLVVGVLPLCLLLSVFFLLLGWNFPGYCDRGDGLRCTGGGLIGFADHIFGFRSGGSMLAVALMIVGPLFFVLLMTTAGLIFAIYKVPRIGPILIGGIYALLAVVVVWFAVGNKWEPILSDGLERGYLSTSNRGHNERLQPTLDKSRAAEP